MRKSIHNNGYQCGCYECTTYYAPAMLELGLRWLHDRYPAGSSHPIARAFQQGYRAGREVIARAFQQGYRAGREVIKLNVLDIYCQCYECTAYYAPVMLELGLRWLHDRAEEGFYNPMFSIRIHAPQGLELGLRWLNDRCADTNRKNANRERQDPSGRWFP